MPAATPDDPEYDRDGYQPLTPEAVEHEADRLRATRAQRKVRKVEFLATLHLAEVDGSAWDDALRFEIRKPQEE